MLLLHFELNHCFIFFFFFFGDRADRKNCSILSKKHRTKACPFGGAMYGWGRWMKAKGKPEV